MKKNAKQLILVSVALLPVLITVSAVAQDHTVHSQDAAKATKQKTGAKSKGHKANQGGVKGDQSGHNMEGMDMSTTPSQPEPAPAQLDQDQQPPSGVHSGHQMPQQSPVQQGQSQQMQGMEDQQKEGMKGHQMGPGLQPVTPKIGEAQKKSQGPMFTLEQLEQLAFKNNPTLPQASAEIASAKGRRLQSGLYPNPSVGYSGEQIRGGSRGGGEQGFFVSQQFILGGKLGLNRRIADQEISQAGAEGEEQRLRVTNAVRILYYQGLASQEMVETRKELARLAGEAVKISRQLYNAGQRDETEVLQAEIEANEADLGVISAENSQRRTLSSLAATVGDRRVESGTLEGNMESDLPAINEEEFVESLLRDSPAVKIAQAGVARAEATLARARREPIPDLQVRAGLQRNGEFLDSLGAHRIGLQGFAEVGIPLNIFNRNQGNVQSARADVERAQQEVRRIQFVLRERASSFVQNYRTSSAFVERYQKQMLPRAQRSYELMLKKYGLMQASYPQALLAQRTLFRLSADYIYALEGLWTNSVALRGFLLTDGLEAPTRPGDLDRPVREINLPSSMGPSPMSMGANPRER